MPENSEPDDVKDDIWVDPDNWEILVAFNRCFTQWVRGTFGEYEGLNYKGVDVVLKRFPRKKWGELFDGIQIMERAALKVLNEKLSKK